LVELKRHANKNTRLRVLTWNIHKGIGGIDRRYDLRRVIEVLTYYDADVMLLQEVAQNMPSLRGDDQVEKLAEALGGHTAFHPEHQFRKGGYGNLILSRWPVAETEHVDLTIGLRKRRGLIQAHVRVPCAGRSRTLILNNLHLGLAGSERGKQLERFVDSNPFTRVRERTPLVVGGDLNDLWGSLGPRYLIPKGLARAGRLHSTFPAAYPIRPLDGLFYRGDLVVRDAYVGRSRLARTAPDHLPIYADFDMY
jgi:endonuclease/exonuclease/phosphatase family metal-dependent hydrolase